MFTMSVVYAMIWSKGCGFLRIRTFFRFGIVLSLLLTLCIFASAASYSSLDALLPGCTETDWDILRQTNQRRLQYGMTPFSTFPDLYDAAEVRAAEISSSFSHTRPDGNRCFTVLTQSGLYYSSAAENIAAGQATAASAMTAWMNSEGHRSNILSTKTVHLGAAHFYGSRNNWVQLFMNYKCSFDSMDILVGPKGLILNDGQTLDDLDLIVRLHCTVHGDCYMPLLQKMCKVRGQTVTVTYDTLSTSFKLGELTPVSENGFTALIKNGSAAIIGCSRTESVLTLPQTIGGYPVTSIAAGAFADTPNLLHLYVPSKTVTAAADAFSNTNLAIWAEADSAIYQQAFTDIPMYTRSDRVLQATANHVLFTTLDDYTGSYCLAAAYDSDARMIDIQEISGNSFMHLQFPSSVRTNRITLFRLDENNIPIQLPEDLWPTS